MATPPKAYCADQEPHAPHRHRTETYPGGDKLYRCPGVFNGPPPEESGQYRIADLAEALVAQRGGNSRNVLDTQFLVLAEETGEAVKNYRRLSGRARARATADEVFDELADVVITARVTAEIMGVDLEWYVRRKLEAIRERGGI